MSWLAMAMLDCVGGLLGSGLGNGRTLQRDPYSAIRCVG